MERGSAVEETLDIQVVLPQTETILRSYRHWLRKDLITPKGGVLDQATALLHAPFVVAAANAEADPILVYGNQKALDLWELPWGKFIRTLARKTAEPMEQEDRDRFLAEVRKNGFVTDYSGIRISSTGRRFRIRQATVWNLLDEGNRYCGQAASFDRWDDLR